MNPFVEERGGRFQVGPFGMHAYPDHLHAEAEVICVLEGGLSVSAEGENYALEAGDLCIFFPSVVHGYAGGEGKALMLIFQPELTPDFPSLLSYAHPKNPVLRRQQLPPDVPLCVEQLRRESEGGMNKSVMRGYIQVLLARMLPMLEMKNRAPEDSDVMFGILKYLSIHYREPVTLEDLAKALCVSKSHLSHSFSERLGVNFRTYLNTLRLNRACELLRSAALSVTDAAYESGFESYRTFNRVFLEKYGCTPSEYRKQHQLMQTKGVSEA